MQEEVLENSSEEASLKLITQPSSISSLGLTYSVKDLSQLEENSETTEVDLAEISQQDELFDWPYKCLTAEDPQMVYEPEVNPDEIIYPPSFKGLEYPEDIKVYLTQMRHCNYSDGAFDLQIVKNDKQLRKFTYIAAGMRFDNISPDKSSMIFTGTKSPETENLNRKTFMYDFVNDNLVILPSSRCTNDRYYWIDNEHFASFNILSGHPHQTQEVEVCIFSKLGELQRVLKTRMNLFMGYPGGLQFSGDIKIEKDRILMIVNEGDYERSECKLRIEKSSGKFYEMTIFETNTYFETLKCGEIIEPISLYEDNLSVSVRIYHVDSMRLVSF